MVKIGDIFGAFLENINFDCPVLFLFFFYILGVGGGGDSRPTIPLMSTSPAWLEVTFSSVFLAGNLLCVSADKKNLGH